MAPIGPYSRRKALAKLSGRTREGRLLRDTRKALIDHVGGSPSVTEQMLIERIANLHLRIAVMDRKFTETGVMTDHDTNTYLAWVGSYTRTLRELGLHAHVAPTPGLAEIIAAHHARKAS